MTSPVLTSEQREHFLEHGWIRVPGAIPDSIVELMVGNAWIRLGMDPNDKFTWDKEKIHMPRHRQWHPRDLSPKAWGAMCELLGGEDRIDPTIFDTWGDGLIVNLGTEYWENHSIEPKDLGNWHNDGDWFKHFLDSGEQGLIVITILNDIVPGAGGTYLAEDGLGAVCKWLHARPKGTNIYLRDPDGNRAIDAIQKCHKFVELTGQKGDVILVHPLMPHSASKNHKRIPRFITNPPVTLKEPFKLDRPHKEDFSLVELTTLRTLGVDSLPDWRATGTRERFVPVTRAGKNQLIEAELERMRAHAEATGTRVESMHLVV